MRRGSGSALGAVAAWTGAAGGAAGGMALFPIAKHERFDSGVRGGAGFVGTGEKARGGVQENAETAGDDCDAVLRFCG